MAEIDPEHLVEIYKDGRAKVRRAREVGRGMQRAGRLTKDLRDVVVGKPRERDRAGRPKMREWEKEWAKTAALTVAGGAALWGAKKALKNGVKVPEWAEGALNNLRRPRKFAPKAKPPKSGGAQRIIHAEFSAEDPTRVDLLTPEGISVARAADVRGNSFRVYTSAAKTRSRRRKRPEERIEAERERHRKEKVGYGVLGGASGLGVGLAMGALAHKMHIKRKASLRGQQAAATRANRKEAEASGKMVPLEELAKHVEQAKKKMGLSSAEKLTEFGLGGEIWKALPAKVKVRLMRAHRAGALGAIKGYVKGVADDVLPQNRKWRDLGIAGAGMTTGGLAVAAIPKRKNSAQEFATREPSRSRMQDVKDGALAASAIGSLGLNVALLRQNRNVADANEMNADLNRVYRGAKEFVGRQVRRMRPKKDVRPATRVEKLREGAGKIASATAEWLKKRGVQFK
ncbi:hypothetical protein EBZ80_15805 [bacterium]|nr:hypothetical protein [bacterium]